MRERLGDREPPCRRASGRRRRAGTRPRRRSSARRRARPPSASSRSRWWARSCGARPDGVVDRLAVARERERRLERDRRLERGEVVARAGRAGSRGQSPTVGVIGRAGGRPPTSTPSRSSISCPSACPGAATASQPSTSSPGSSSSGSGWKRMNGRYSDPCPISSSVTSCGDAVTAGTTRRGRRTSPRRPRRGSHCS